MYSCDSWQWLYWRWNSVLSSFLLTVSRYRLRAVRHSEALLWLDYCNAVLADLPASTLTPLQWVSPIYTPPPARHVLFWATVWPGCPAVALTTSRAVQSSTSCAWRSTSRLLDTRRLHIAHLLTSVAQSALRAWSSDDLVVLPTRRRTDDMAFSVTLNLLRSTTTFRRQLNVPVCLRSYTCTTVDSFSRLRALYVISAKAKLLVRLPRHSTRLSSYHLAPQH